MTPRLQRKNLSARRRCPCGSGESYGECCGPLLAGLRDAETAEQLMRSRYTAFCLNDVDYLVNTHHPSSRPRDLRASLETSLPATRWVKLEIVETFQGEEDDNVGEVEFIAHHREGNHDKGSPAAFHERSRFVRNQGRWFYISGIVHSRF